MGIKTLFFDTYALYEMIGGNPAYAQYTKNIAITTTRLNLMELYYGLLIKYGLEAAERYFDKFSEFAVEIDNTLIKRAMQFRANNKKMKLSYIDCIGYVVALAKNTRFLTGDEAFRKMPNVEFVK